jgi:murein L,D-transpeptidase YcbB/YkuD
LFVLARYTARNGSGASSPPPLTQAQKLAQIVKLTQLAKQKPKPPAKPQPKAAVRPVIGPVVIDHPDVTPAGQAPLQAAVDAAVTQAIRETPAAPATPAAAPAAAKRTPLQAAKDLKAFLLRTGRHGTLKDRPAEVKAAQRDMGLTDDGIVGKRTRAAAQKLGVALPPAK